MHKMIFHLSVKCSLFSVAYKIDNIINVVCQILGLHWRVACLQSTVTGMQ